MNQSYEHPVKSSVDKVPIRYIRSFLIFSWFCSAAYLGTVSFLDANEMSSAVAINLMLAVTITLTWYFEHHSISWKLTAPLFLFGVTFHLFLGENVLVVLAMSGMFLFLMVAIILMMKSSFIHRKRMAEEIRDRRKVDSLWRLMLSGIPNDVIRGMSKKRKRIFNVSIGTISVMSMSGVGVYAVMMWLLSAEGLKEAIQPADMLYVMLSVYVPVLLVFPSLSLVTSLLAAELVEKQTLLGELGAAREAQASLLPTSVPEVAGFDISGVCRPASDVGGDFYDYVWLDEKRTLLGIAVADVAGKAMKAAMAAVMTSGMVYQEAGDSTSPRQILRKINKPMFLKTDRRMFTACCFAVIDIRRRTLRLSNAGQAYPILLRKGETTFIEIPGERVPLGVKQESSYQEKLIRLKRDDVVVFYTDGIVEAMNGAKEMFGFDRIKQTIGRNASATASALRDALLSDVDAFAAGAPQNDDITAVVVRVL